MRLSSPPAWSCACRRRRKQSSTRLTQSASSRRRCRVCAKRDVADTSPSSASDVSSIDFRGADRAEGLSFPTRGVGQADESGMACFTDAGHVRLRSRRQGKATTVHEATEANAQAGQICLCRDGVRARRRGRRSPLGRGHPTRSGRGRARRRHGRSLPAAVGCGGVTRHGRPSH